MTGLTRAHQKQWLVFVADLSGPELRFEILALHLVILFIHIQKITVSSYLS